MHRSIELALSMDEGDAISIVTMADEPELIIESSDELAAFWAAMDPETLAAARIVCAWISADYNDERTVH